MQLHAAINNDNVYHYIIGICAQTLGMIKDTPLYNRHMYTTIRNDQGHTTI